MNDALRTDYVSDFEVIRRCIGKRVVSLAHARYAYNGEPDTLNLGDVEFTFADGTVVLLTLEGDGDSVRAASSPLRVPEPLDVDGSGQAQWDRVELSKQPEYSFVLEAVLTDVNALIDEWVPQASEALIGWEFRFDAGPPLTYYNAGDEGRLLIGETPPVYERVERRRAPVPV